MTPHTSNINLALITIYTIETTKSGQVTSRNSFQCSTTSTQRMLEIVEAGVKSSVFQLTNCISFIEHFFWQTVHRCSFQLLRWSDKGVPKSGKKKRLLADFYDLDASPKFAHFHAIKSSDFPRELMLQPFLFTSFFC